MSVANNKKRQGIIVMQFQLYQVSNIFLFMILIVVTNKRFQRILPENVSTVTIPDQATGLYSGKTRGNRYIVFVNWNIFQKAF